MSVEHDGIDRTSEEWQIKGLALLTHFELWGLEHKTAVELTKALSGFSEKPPVIYWVCLHWPIEIKLEVFDKPLVLSLRRNRSGNFGVPYDGESLPQESIIYGGRIICGEGKLRGIQLGRRQENDSPCLLFQFGGGKVLGVEKDLSSRTLVTRL